MNNGMCNIAIKDKKYKSGSSRSLNSLGTHLLRNHKEKQTLIDYDRTKNNEVLIEMTHDTLSKSLNYFLKKNDLKTRNVTTVQAYQVVFSIPGKTFDNPKLIEEWKKSTLEFINTNPIFKDNCLLAVYHGDELQPHIQCAMVSREGKKLNFKSLLGGLNTSQKLSQLHDDYAATLKPLGFSRGDGTHTTGLDYEQYIKAAVEMAKPTPPPVALKPVPEVGLLNKTSVIEILQENVERLKVENKKLKTVVKKIVYVETQNSNLRTNNTKLRSIAKKYKTKNEALEAHTMKITKEQTELLRHIPCDEVLDSLGFQPMKEGLTTRVKNEDINLVITDNKFTENKTMKQGFGAISMLVDVFNYKFSDAVTYLSSNFGFERTAKLITANKKQSAEMIKQAVKSSMLEIPKPSNQNINKVIDYLINTRKLSKTLIDDLIKQNRLYTDSKNNCIFTNDKNTFAFIRGTYSEKRFVGVKGDIDFIKYDFGKSDNKYLFESVIDALSYRTMNPTADGEYIVLNGSALINRVHEVVTSNTKVFCCFDNDEQGKKFCDNIKSQLVCEVEVITPQTKDFNEDLQHGHYTKPDSGKRATNTTTGHQQARP